ncbi:unnamed protein product [Durusdinium trenchii]|uniref:Uncharacterized protein n=1 Tax=Durusdinium trenchii TaxID=1381693 RepID=A0ABP0R8G5_9DINO
MAPKALPSRNVPSAVMKMMMPRVVKAKTSAEQNTELYSALDMVPCEFPVTLDLKHRPPQEAQENR